jgi:alkylation response protein AidB-like acyl-CoA dehydrogenase
MTVVSADIELEQFRRGARDWLLAHVPRSQDLGREIQGGSDGLVERARKLQRMIFDAGYAGIVFPREYGGRGLGPEFARAFAEEAAPFESPLVLQEPTLNIIAPTILDCGNEKQKRRYLPRMLRGDDRWVQFLSEPSAGSDVASAITSAERVDGGYVLNGSKIWSSGADRSDWALCPARTDWDLPKHHGLTVFLVPIRQTGIEVRPVRTSDGAAIFCQEFLTDVFVPDEQVLGAVNGGWSVIMTLINHERKAVAGASPFTGGARNRPSVGRDRTLARLAAEVHGAEEPMTRQLIGRQVVGDLVQEKLNARVLTGLRLGDLPESASTILRLFEGINAAHRATAAVQIAGVSAVAWRPDSSTDGVGLRFLMRQASSIGGGTTEMARNAISERVLGMPREATPDRNVPFRQVDRSR